MEEGCCVIRGYKYRDAETLHTTQKSIFKWRKVIIRGNKYRDAGNPAHYTKEHI